MPFVPRAVEPRFVSRTSLRDAEGRPRVRDGELQAVTNCTLAGALRQLASLVLLADDVFNELALQLSDVTSRSQALRCRVAGLGELVASYDPKKVTVPEGSLSNFAARKVHYKAKHPLGKELFTPSTRPRCVRDLYEKATAGRPPAALLQQLRHDSQHSPYLLCTPVLGSRRRHKIDADIDAHVPAAVEELRKWTSREALGEVTALPDASTRIACGVTLTLTPDELSDVGSGDDEPLDHQLPSPEEQLRVIIRKFAPEVIPIDTSGKFFDRMCTSRKSLIHIETTGETDTVKRRTRSRKPRGKRRNTISGTDQKELREAIAGDTSSPVASQETPDSSTVVRSHSSDLLKRSPVDLLAKKSSHFHSLKQWGKTRLKMISRSPSSSRDSFRDSLRSEKSKENKSPNQQDTEVVQETVTMRRKRSVEQERRLSHQRCASYSSDEKSTGVPASIAPTATITTGVKLRSCSAQRRLRRAGVGKEEPHSSSGNWSASSESGRTSIGSEITTTTVPPKSTTSAGTSSNSINTHSHGPPSSIISRRRFLNTSGSGSVTSEGTLTPDIIHDLHEDLETSSEYSCDTEGYYTSFHMDSGLKTLKEEEAPSTPMHTSNALSNSSTIQNITAENEYELFGKGSTSTTTSSAGTVCTTLMAAGSDRSLVIGPTVPERKSSLTKLNRSKGSIHSANASLDRNYSSNSADRFSSLRFHRDLAEKQRFNYSMPSTNELPEATITITKNVGQPQETVLAMVHSEPEADSAKKSTGTSSPDSGHNTSSSPIEDSVSSAQGKHSLSEQDYSESSDLEGTDRIERIRYKTTINSSRIPSLCVITPSNSDDESVTSYKESEEKKPPTVVEMHKKVNARPKLELPKEANIEKRNKEITNETIKPVGAQKTTNQLNIKSSLMPLNNLMCRLKGVLPNKLSTKKSPTIKEPAIPDNIYDSGDYVTIADVRNNNQKASLHTKGVYGTNDMVKKNLQTVLSGKLQETEYICLNELPNCLNESKDFLESTETKTTPAQEEFQRKGAKVTLDSQGKVIYSSDSIRRRKGAHTTFEPGPFVKEEKPDITKGHSSDNGTSDSDEVDNNIAMSPLVVPMSPQLGKIIIKAPADRDGPVTTELISLPAPKPSTIITAALVPERPSTNKVQPEVTHTVGKPHLNAPENITPKGAYVNIQDAEGVSLSPTRENSEDYRRSPADPRHFASVPKPARAPTRFNFPLPSATGQRMEPPGILNYEHPPPPATFQRDTSVYWSLRPQRNGVQAEGSRTRLDYNSLQRYKNIPQVPLRHPQNPPMPGPNVDETLKISPIDPRTTAPFHASTPSRDSIANLSSKMLSPVKSSMSNDELYAVIHKSKKKLNIKDQQDRCDSPALSTISLSPVSSESSLAARPAPKLPESGYLGDPRARNSWAFSRDDQGFNSNRFQVGRNARPETTCADRMGPLPQTSRMDFKRLLLQHGVKLNTLAPQQPSSKISAVEQLRINKIKPVQQQHSNLSQVNILDLSGSPKTYSHRKVMRSVPSNVSPNRTNALIKEHKSTPKILLSPKSQWRFSSPRSDVLSSPILEVNNEDDISNSSGEKHESPTTCANSKTVPIVTNQHFGARRNLIPINENLVETESDFPEFGAGVKPIVQESQETRQERKSRTEMLQAKRAEFFNSSPEGSPPRFTSFKTPDSRNTGNGSTLKRTPSPPALETAL